MLTEDVLYETYRTEKLSRAVNPDHRDSQLLPEDLASQSVRLKEEQLRREEEKVKHRPCIPVKSVANQRALVARSRAQNATRNQREAPRAYGQGNHPQVCGEPTRFEFILTFIQELGEQDCRSRLQYQLLMHICFLKASPFFDFGASFCHLYLLYTYTLCMPMPVLFLELFSQCILLLTRYNMIHRHGS